jgi:hypothetical protein
VPTLTQPEPEYFITDNLLPADESENAA